MFYRQNLTQFAIYRITFPGVSFKSFLLLWIPLKSVCWGKSSDGVIVSFFFSVSFFFPPNGWKLEGMRTQCHHSWLDDAFKRTGFLCEVQGVPHRAKRWIFLSLKWQNWVIKRVGYGDLPVLQHFAISYTVRTTVFMCRTVTKRSQTWLFKLLMAFRIRAKKKSKWRLFCLQHTCRKATNSNSEGGGALICNSKAEHIFNKSKLKNHIPTFITSLSLVLRKNDVC